METGFNRIDAAEAEWLWNRRPPKSEPQVASLLPGGYDRYLRVFHPFKPWVVRDLPSPTWRQLAERLHVTYGAALMWEDLEPVLPSSAGGRPYSVEEGELDRRQLGSLLRDLVENNNPIFFYFGLASVVATSNHEPLCFRGTIESLEKVKEVVDDLAQQHVCGPEYLWDENKNWIICTDYDLVSTYIACNGQAAKRVLSDMELEAVEVEPSTPLSKRGRDGVSG